MGLQHKTISVVDDEKDTVTLLKELLQDNEYQAMGFTNPILALDYIREHPEEFALIILDYKMFPMQGCELSNKISSINSKIKMILLTAYDNIKNNDLNLEIVKKPITNIKLLQIVGQYLG